MLHRNWPIVLVGAVVFSLTSCQRGEQAGSETGEAAASSDIGIQAFDQLVTDWDAAFTNRDVEAVVALYDEGAVAMPPNSPALVGREAIGEFFSDLFAQGEIEVENKTETIKIQKDLAIGSGVYTLTLTPPEGEAVTEVGKWVAIAVRQADGSWRTIRNIWNSDMPLPTGS